MVCVTCVSRMYSCLLFHFGICSRFIFYISFRSCYATSLLVAFNDSKRIKLKWNEEKKWIECSVHVTQLLRFFSLIQFQVSYAHSHSIKIQFIWFHIAFQSKWKYIGKWVWLKWNEIESNWYDCTVTKCMQFVLYCTHTDFEEQIFVIENVRQTKIKTKWKT